MEVVDITNQVGREIKIIEQSLGGDLVHVLRESEAILAGGAITSLLTNQDISDYDIYFKNKEGFSNIFRDIYGLNEDCLLSNWGVRVAGSTDKSIYTSYDSEEAAVQFILFDLFEGGAKEIFDSFDFTVCMFAYDFKEGRMYAHKDALKHTAQRHLHFHTGTAFPLISLLRFEKYRQKGYKTSQKEVIKAALSVANKGYESWEDLETELSSMYGVDVSSLFNKSEPFSLDSAITQISNLNNSEVFPSELRDIATDSESLARKFYNKLDENTQKLVRDGASKPSVLKFPKTTPEYLKVGKEVFWL